MNYEEKMYLVRKEMKSLMIEFHEIMKSKSKIPLDPQEKEKICIELLISANEFAKKYHDLRSKYMDLIFFSDSTEAAGEAHAELFRKFKMSRNSENN